MAKIVLATDGKRKLLDQKRAFLNTLKTYLYSSVTGGTPTTASLLADFAPVNDLANNGAATAYAAASIGSGNVAELNAPPITWTFNYNAGVPLPILGYYCVDPADANKVVYSQAFSAAVTITAAGQQYTLTPKFQEDSLP